MLLKIQREIIENNLYFLLVLCYLLEESTFGSNLLRQKTEEVNLSKFLPIVSSLSDSMSKIFHRTKNQRSRNDGS